MGRKTISLRLRHTARNSNKEHNKQLTLWYIYSAKCLRRRWVPWFKHQQNLWPVQKGEGRWNNLVLDTDHTLPAPALNLPSCLFFIFFFIVNKNMAIPSVNSEKSIFLNYLFLSYVACGQLVDYWGWVITGVIRHLTGKLNCWVAYFWNSYIECQKVSGLSLRDRQVAVNGSHFMRCDQQNSSMASFEKLASCAQMVLREGLMVRSHLLVFSGVDERNWSTLMKVVYGVEWLGGWR